MCKLPNLPAITAIPLPASYVRKSRRNPKPEREKCVAIFAAQIAEWLDQNLSVIRMLELARANTEHPYAGKDTAFYDYVRKIRRARKQAPGNLALRFEGVPANFYRSIGGKCVDWSFAKKAWNHKRATSSPPGSKTAATCM